MGRRIICAISGVALTEDDEAVLDELTPSDEAPELPVGWTRITMENRMINPNYEAIQYVKAGLIAQVLAQMPPEQREYAEEGVAIQFDAQFAALEARPDNVATQLNKIEVYIAPVDRVQGLDKELEKIFAVLGIEVTNDSEDEDGDEDGDDTNQSEEDETPDVSQATARRRRRSKPKPSA